MTCQSLRRTPVSLQIRITKASVIGSTRVVASQNNCSNGANLESDMATVLEKRVATPVFLCVQPVSRAQPQPSCGRGMGLPHHPLNFLWQCVALPHHIFLHKHSQNIGSDPFTSSPSLSHPEQRYPFVHQDGSSSKEEGSPATSRNRPRQRQL